MRIAVVTPFFPWVHEGYRGRAIFETVRGLQHYADVQVFCPIAEYPEWLSLIQPQQHNPRYSHPELSLTYFSYPAVPLLSRPLNGEACARRLYPYLRQARPDLVLNYWIYPDGYASVKVAHALGLPAIVSARGSDLLQVRDPLTGRLTSQTVRNADHVLTVSEELRRRAMELGVPGERTTTIPNGCNHRAFRPGDRISARLQLGIAEDEQVILYVGRFVEPKGILELYQAFAESARERPGLRLVCVGAGPLRPRMESYAEALGIANRILLPGEQRLGDVTRWMLAADLLCLPSHSEGCPNVVIEAMCSGCPVVASDVGGVAEILTSKCGILVPPRDVKQLIRGLNAGLEIAWNRPAIGASFARTWEEVARETYEACQNVSAPFGRSTPLPKFAIAKKARAG